MVARSVVQRLVDPHSGELVGSGDGVLAVVFPRARSPFSKGGFSMVSHVSMAEAVEVLRPNTVRVLVCVVATVEPGNWIPLRQVDVCARLSLSRPAVSRAFGELREHGLIFEDQRSPASPAVSLRLSPLVAWCGSAKSHREAIQAFGRRTGVYASSVKRDVPAGMSAVRLAVA